MFIPNPMLYHHVVIIFSIKMSGKSPKTEPTCSCVSAAASAESCGSLVIIATCSPKIPSPVRMDQHPPETMVDVGDWGGVLTKLRDGITWHHLHWAISSYPSAQPAVPYGPLRPQLSSSATRRWLAPPQHLSERQWISGHFAGKPYYQNNITTADRIEQSQYQNVSKRNKCTFQETSI